MLETIAMWGGVAGIIVAIFSVITIFLVKQNINNILNKETVLIDENFHIKQSAINKAMAIVDEVVENGEFIKGNISFNQKAKLAYNELLCVITDVRIADEFYNIAIDEAVAYNEARIAQFKLMCRKDIGLKIGKANAVRRILAKQAQQKKEQRTQPAQQVQPLQQPQPMQQTQPVQYTQAPQQSIPQTQARMVQPRPVQQVARPTQGPQPMRPTQPMQQPRPIHSKPENPNNGKE